MNSPSVKVSIIMLAYNIGRYIETAIKGVIQQKTNYQIQLVLRRIAAQTTHWIIVPFTKNCILI
jgi:glycosyltransferase involved in cell wall biosynthesis